MKREFDIAVISGHFTYSLMTVARVLLPAIHYPRTIMTEPRGIVMRAIENNLD